jgi:hypothetical protein
LAIIKPPLAGAVPGVGSPAASIAGVPFVPPTVGDDGNVAGGATATVPPALSTVAPPVSFPGVPLVNPFDGVFATGSVLGVVGNAKYATTASSSTNAQIKPTFKSVRINSLQSFSPASPGLRPTSLSQLYRRIQQTQSNDPPPPSPILLTTPS